MRDQEDPFLPDGGAWPLHLHQPLYVGAPLPPTWRPLPSFSLSLLSSVQKGLVKQSGLPAGGNGFAGPGPTSTIFWPEGLAPPFLSCPSPREGGRRLEEQKGSKGAHGAAFLPTRQMLMAAVPPSPSPSPAACFAPLPHPCPPLLLFIQGHAGCIGHLFPSAPAP